LKNKGIVYVKFPKTGLGNLLLIWARAKVFAEINKMEIITSSWWAFRWGTILRNENKKRFYFGYFKENSIWEKLKVFFIKYFWIVCYEPEIKKLTNNNKRLFVFKNVVIDDDLFKYIRTHRTFIKYELENLLNPALLKQLQQYPIPEISVHIRRGDFKYGNPITPLSFFINAINLIRDLTKQVVTVTVFTDAEKEEIEEIFSLPCVSMASIKPDILDILLMSKSKVLVLSQSSTFSYWGAFLSEAIIIKPIDDWQNNIRDEKTNFNFYEGKICFEKNIGDKELRAVLSKLGV